MRAPTGKGLACRAWEHSFKQEGRVVKRGVLSYFAARALPAVVTTAGWLRSISELVEADVRAGSLPFERRPALQVLGHGRFHLPGDCVSP